MSHQFIDLVSGQTLAVDGPARITLERKSGQRARLKVSAPVQTRIHQPGAQECANAAKGAVNGKYPVREGPPAFS